jgi:opacity protein-like surface antigen
MVSVTLFIAAAAAVIVSTTAHAADMPLPAPQIVYQQQPCCDTGRWYLRGDVGVGVQTFSSFDHGQTNSVFVWPASWTIVQKDIQDSAIFGMGIGYAWNSWLRFDVTGEYRTRAGFKSTGSFTEFCPGGTCSTSCRATSRRRCSWPTPMSILAPGGALRPFIGAGIGGARNMISGVQDLGLNQAGAPGFGFTTNDSAQWNLAWDVQAGLTYNVTDSFKVDLSWRFLNLGSPQTAVVHCQNTPTCPGAFFTLHDMTSQDFRVGLRWLFPAGSGFGFGGFAQPAFAPAAAQYMPAPAPQYVPAPPPQYVPAPQPQYMQPPLTSRG